MSIRLSARQVFYFSLCRGDALVVGWLFLTKPLTPVDVIIGSLPDVCAADNCTIVLRVSLYIFCFPLLQTRTSRTGAGAERRFIFCRVNLCTSTWFDRVPLNRTHLLAEEHCFWRPKIEKLFLFLFYAKKKSEKEGKKDIFLFLLFMCIYIYFVVYIFF